MARPPRWGHDEWQAANEVLMRRCRGRCERCGQELRGVERHHRQRRRDGGDRLANIVVLCREDHRSIHAHPVEARMHGFIVSFAADPEEWPVKVADRWVWLRDDGGSEPLSDDAVAEWLLDEKWL